jgi:hypothetical protein
MNESPRPKDANSESNKPAHLKSTFFSTRQHGNRAHRQSSSIARTIQPELYLLLCRPENNWSADYDTCETVTSGGEWNRCRAGIHSTGISILYSGALQPHHLVSLNRFCTIGERQQQVKTIFAIQQQYFFSPA